jgi:hypothetical protein
MKTFTMGFVLGLSLVGCATESSDAELGLGTQEARNGTSLSATATASEPVCLPGGTAAVDIAGVLTSQASAAWAEVTMSIDGGPAVSIDEVEPTQFSKGGKVKTFSYTYGIELPEGEHDVRICFIQPSGQYFMTACADVTGIVVSCADDPDGASCHQNGAFGETIGNHNMCGGNAQSINVQAKGDFGDDAQLHITGPGGYDKTTNIRHNGNSCVYHYRWAVEGDNGGVGDYTFTVSGAGNTETWTSELFCL